MKGCLVRHCIMSFFGSNPPSANFFRLLCSVVLPQKVCGIFGLKTQKTGLGLAVIAIPKPVFFGFTVFWAISALKARKLPDLSGRQIRQSIYCITLKRCLEAGYYCQKYTCGYSFNQHSSLENQGIECYSNNKGIA